MVCSDVSGIHCELSQTERSKGLHVSFQDVVLEVCYRRLVSC
jgi:hypothetical protein